MIDPEFEQALREHILMTDKLFYDPNETIALFESYGYKICDKPHMVNAPCDDEWYKEWDGDLNSSVDLGAASDFRFVNETGPYQDLPAFFEPTEDSPMLYFKENYPIPVEPKIITFDENGNSYGLKSLLDEMPRWRLEGHWQSQQEAIDFYFNYGFESEVL